ncbi:YgfZ/GcvT domain-containing protein [Arenimonas sp. MALMAid1274]|uniref:CAF17-like 4Fe-4S cluster assembly/insertion protein YgfZ n=1 Tax=Arenimonas sp. MALMAid1274 TaxID=3411630 RepID=UPI003BA0C282
MTFKTNLVVEGCPALSGFELLAVHGPDAAAFLQAQTMNDVLALAPGQWHWNGWLTAKGRVIALFALLRQDEASFLLVLPDHPAEALKSALQRYVFRSKLQLDAATGWVVAAGPTREFAAPDQALGDAEHGWSLDLGGEGGPRTLCLLPPDSPQRRPAEDRLDAAWREADLAHGLPRLPESQREAWTPQMLSLDRLAAFSLKKGCYPGQEIVARTHYLGQAKRGLVRLSGQGLMAGMAVADEAGATGTLVCAGSDGGIGLAVMAAGAEGPFQAGGHPCHRLPLLGGLARQP